MPEPAHPCRALVGCNARCHAGLYLGLCLSHSPDLSPYDEGAVHDSFHEIIQEQGLQLRELCLGGKGNASLLRCQLTGRGPREVM